MTFVTAIERLETGLLIWVDNHRYRKTIKLLILLLRRPGRTALYLVTVSVFIWTVFGMIAECMANSRHMAEVTLIAAVGLLSAMEAVQ